MRFFGVFILLFFAVFCGVSTFCAAQSSTDRDQAIKSRPFHMGFTRWPPELTLEGQARADQFIEDHADLVALHFDNGIPWPEAHGLTRYSKNVMERLTYTIPEGKKLYVAVTPINLERDGLAPYWAERDGLPLPEPWNKARFNDDSVKRAYTKYLGDVVERLQPDYLCIGIEVNLLIEKSPGKWADYVELHRYAYEHLKKTYKKLPIFVSFAVLHLNGLADGADKERQYKLVRDIMPYSDYFGMSVYPYMSWDVPAPIPDDFFDFARSFGRPIVVAESGYSSRNVWVSLFLLSGSEKLQNHFLDRLLRAAVRDSYVFIVNYAAIDFDKMIGSLPSNLRGLAGIWQYTGLMTSRGKAKPALALWDAYHQLPYYSPERK